MGLPLNNRIEVTQYTADPTDVSANTLVKNASTDSDAPTLTDGATTIAQASVAMAAANYELVSVEALSATLALWTWQLVRRPNAWEHS